MYDLACFQDVLTHDLPKLIYLLWHEYCTLNATVKAVP